MNGLFFGLRRDPPPRPVAPRHAPAPPRGAPPHISPQAGGGGRSRCVAGRSDDTTQNRSPPCCNTDSVGRIAKISCTALSYIIRNEHQRGGRRVGGVRRGQEGALGTG